MFPKGKREGKLYQVLTNNNYCGETPWETFNKHMDATFGEDCQNTEGHLENMCQGWFGMDIVTKYLHIAIRYIATSGHLLTSYDCGTDWGISHEQSHQIVRVSHV